MAEIFLAKSAIKPDAPLLAIKRTLPKLSADNVFFEMFHDEARIAFSLEHPNIINIRDYGDHNGQQFIAMDFIHGKDLLVVRRRLLQRGESLAPRIAAAIVSSIADALDYAHQKLDEKGEPMGIVHRDVSPQNILISYEGVPSLIDFGIAKAKDRVASTQVGMVKGKFAYMSPEQAQAHPLDHRSDIYTLGIILY
ncbi:serine/threonine protein kinase, partial [Myxococcota bacterium]|nr:serine/threonine protein kinase [Myxococcota bacterium]